jgi:hypothetical protein
MPRKGSPCPCEPDVLAYSGLPPVPEPRTPKDLPGGEEQGTAMLWQMWAAFHEHLARIEAKVDRLAPPPEPEPEPPPVPPLVRALGAAFGASGFTSREAWHRATSDPALWQALQETGITAWQPPVGRCPAVDRRARRLPLALRSAWRIGSNVGPG